MGIVRGKLITLAERQIGISSPLILLVFSGPIHVHLKYLDFPLTMPEGEVLEVFVTKKRNRKAALRFLKKAMRRHGSPRAVVTDRLRSYRAAMKIIGNAGRQVTGWWLNNRAENSHQPFRRRERAMARFRSAESLQKFTSIHSSIHNHFNQERHLYNRKDFKLNRNTALAEWRQLAA